ncbi:MAG: hypothetical protein Q4F57_00170 [Weeksellaceae bacterium]|nr:hypothetical protein [Weeksellaceae bacterium]
MESKISYEKIGQLISYALILTMILFFLVDFIGKIGDRLHPPLAQISVWIKPIVFFFAGGAIYYFRHCIPRWVLIAFPALIISFLLGQYFLPSEHSFLQQVAFNSKTLVWYLFPILIYPLVLFHTTLNIPLIKKVFEAIFIVNAIFAIAGLVLDIQLFGSYHHSRFGYNGLFRFSTHSSFLYMIYMFYFYIQLKTNFNRKYLLLYTLAIILAAIAGSKLLFLFIFGLSLLLLPKPYNRIAIGAGIAVIAALSIYQDWFMQHIIAPYFPVLADVADKSGMASMLFSERDILFQEGFLPYIQEKWSIMNVLFGGADFHLFRSQFEFVDLFWFFGIIGTGIYLFFWYRMIYSHTHFSIAWLLFWLLVALAGNFFSTITVTLTFLIFILLISRIHPSTQHINTTK